MTRFLRVLVAVVAATGVSAPGMASAGSVYDWPLNPQPEVVRGFDPPAQRWQSGHRGLDLAGAPGTPVLAAGAGTVRFVGVVAGTPVVSLAHPDGIITTYEPVDATATTGAGVSRGQVIGHLAAGHPGCSAAACLHWGARRGAGSSATYLNPLALLDALRVRLKPYDG